MQRKRQQSARRSQRSVVRYHRGASNGVSGVSVVSGEGNSGRKLRDTLRHATRLHLVLRSGTTTASLRLTARCLNATLLRHVYINDPTSPRVHQ